MASSGKVRHPSYPLVINSVRWELGFLMQAQEKGWPFSESRSSLGTQGS